jgi:hypothetical protein
MAAKGSQFLEVLLVAVGAVVAYALPAIVALARPLPKPDRWSISLCSLFLGWTVIVWAACLWWAFAYSGQHLGGPASDNGR